MLECGKGSQFVDCVADHLPFLWYLQADAATAYMQTSNSRFLIFKDCAQVPVASTVCIFSTHGESTQHRDGKGGGGVGDMREISFARMTLWKMAEKDLCSLCAKQSFIRNVLMRTLR